jgi:hypothetical protein
MRVFTQLIGIILINVGGFMLGTALAMAFTCGLIWGAMQCIF